MDCMVTREIVLADCPVAWNSNDALKRSMISGLWSKRCYW
jgi:hypothetical protein